MTNNRNSTQQSPSKVPEKMNDKAIGSQKQHSTPFYISPSLFHNKRLKHKRCKWAEVARKMDRRQKLKTDRRKQKLNSLQADVTIDLLSDEDDKDNVNTKVNQPSFVPVNNPALLSLQQNQQSILIYPNNIKVCNGSNVTFIPPVIAIPTPKQKFSHRRRKTHQPKRHTQPTIVNNESIVLTDDSDIEEVLPNQDHRNSPSIPLNSPQTPPGIAHVDEEVTVSLVPRSSTAGNCVKNVNTEPFPMLPDETTVHTVIANRIYELSLTKLREGLASSGVGEFADEQQKVLPTRRKGKVNPPTLATPPPPPISLKLSSDLSISLISDDDEDGGEEQLSPELLLQQQPHLSVQQVQVPITMNVATTRQVTKRRKLG